MRLFTRRPRAALILLCLALWLPGFFTLPPTDRDESRFVLATRQMVESGDYVRIMNGAVPRDKKPIGIHWLQAPFEEAARAAGLATQNPVWPYRIPSLLGGILAVLATAAIADALLPDPRAGLLAGALLASSVILTTEAHIAKTDAALLGATTLAMLILARAWSGRATGRGAAAFFWLALAAGILIKGPIAPILLGLTAVTACTAGRRWRWLAPLRPAWGLPLMLVAVLPWFVAIGLATHGAFFTHAVGGDLGHKLAGGEESHGAWPGLHLLLLPLLSFPGTIPVVLGLAAAFARRREPATLFLLAWLVPSWLLFEAVPTKLPHYTLPLYPALCLLAADACTRPRAIGAALKIAAPIAQGGLAVAAIALAGAALAVPIFLHAPAWLGVPAAMLAAATAILAWRLGVAAGALAAVPLYAALLQWELPRLDALWIAPRAAAALRAAWSGAPPDGAQLFAVGYAEPSLMFLLGPRLKFLPTGRLAAQAWIATPHAAALIAAPETEAFLAAAKQQGATIKQATTIQGFNYARGRSMALTIYIR